MKDIRDLMNLIEEGQNEFDPDYAYFDGVWANYNKIHNRTVPDAVAVLSPDAIRHQARRQQTKKAPMKQMAKMKKDDGEDFTITDLD